MIKAHAQRLQFIAAGLASLLAGCGLPGPTHKGGALVALENRPDCGVYGVWERYTWSGECEGGLTSGSGTLLGYGGSTLMLRYEGEMKAGLRDGMGEMWMNAEKFNGGPVTRAGRFSRGNIVTGSETNNYSVRTYADGKNASTVYTAQESESSSGVGSALALVGAAMQGVAAGGGKNAAQLAALGSAMQGTAQPADMRASSGPSNTSPASNFGLDPTVPAVNQCVSLKRTKYSVSFTNTCNYPVAVRYCFTTLSGASQVDASSGTLKDSLCGVKTAYPSGTPSIMPGGTDTQSAPNNAAPIHFMACPSSDIRAQNHIEWDGSSLRGTCGGVIGKESASNGPARKAGAVR
ncbi:hypothetical protein AB870_07590 [Pandoraea faecigallinarum]|uniref:MORN repeat-containing protein n=1 Tax=Pandoraea faecigallinarum TaxID=656179 RepID=A0A0H3WQ55_9BURK|nr:hypothetical protein [Pandoraea faecigallinarum]AKM29992.1 hypothetical protein AB870_07590 [Pandoraea faecigallinarum]